MRLLAGPVGLRFQLGRRSDAHCIRVWGGERSQPVDLRILGGTRRLAVGDCLGPSSGAGATCPDDADRICERPANRTVEAPRFRPERKACA